jgi:hypothetical protein
MGGATPKMRFLKNQEISERSADFLKVLKIRKSGRGNSEDHELFKRRVGDPESPGYG